MLNIEFEQIIREQAKIEAPKECCGLITQNNHELKIHPCKNQSNKPNYQFIISKEETLAAEKFGTIVVFYHSHPQGGDFSVVDRVVVERKNLTCVVYDYVADTFNSYSPCGFKAPYEGRPHVIGVLDCINLAQDYYVRELNLNIPDFTHPLRFCDVRNMKENLSKYKVHDNHPLTNFYLQNEFTQVSGPRKNDLILYRPFRECKSATGVLVYLGNDKVYCHMENSKSKLDLYRTFFRNMTVDIVRHKNYA